MGSLHSSRRPDRHGWCAGIRRPIATATATPEKQHCSRRWRARVRHPAARQSTTLPLCAGKLSQVTESADDAIGQRRKRGPEPNERTRRLSGCGAISQRAKSRKGGNRARTTARDSESEHCNEHSRRLAASLRLCGFPAARVTGRSTDLPTVCQRGTHTYNLAKWHTLASLHKPRRRRR